MPQSDDPVQHGSSDGSLDGIKSEGWTASIRKGGRDQIGTMDDFTSVHMDGLRRYPQASFCTTQVNDFPRKESSSLTSTGQNSRLMWHPHQLS
jgi:hypothetical protein